MKKTIKILVLALSFAFVLVLIMVFINTIIKPPTNVKVSNQFMKSLEDEESDFAKDPDMSFNNMDNHFFVFTETLKIYQENDLLDEQEQSTIKDAFTMEFVAAYANACLDYFHQSHWDEHLLSSMNQRIMQLEQLSSSSYNNCNDIKTVSNVLSNYYKVVALLSTKYTDLASAKNLKSEFIKYKNMPYLSNNTFLKERMDASMKRMGREHYSHLNDRVEELGNYEHMNRNDYDALSSSVNLMLKEYKDNAQSVYGEDLGGSHLSQIAADYYSKASTYFYLFSNP